MEQKQLPHAQQLLIGGILRHRRLCKLQFMYVDIFIAINNSNGRKKCECRSQGIPGNFNKLDLLILS